MKRLTTSLLAIAGATAIAAGYTASVNAQADPDPELLATLIAEGDTVYNSVGCSGCHGVDGGGGNGPALAGNEVLSSRTAVITQIMSPDEEHGVMPAFDGLSDREISAVATYIRNTWGNAFGIVPEDSVALFRANMGGGE